jgi:hypothetical protein
VSTCKRHDMRVIGHRVHCATRGNGRALPKFVIYEIGKCSRCGDQAYRERGTVRAVDAREAAQFAGLPQAEWPAGEKASKSEAIEVPLKSWPFKASAHVDAEAKTTSRRRKWAGAGAIE